MWGENRGESPTVCEAIVGPTIKRRPRTMEEGARLPTSSCTTAESIPWTTFSRADRAYGRSVKWGSRSGCGRPDSAFGGRQLGRATKVLPGHDASWNTRPSV